MYYFYFYFMYIIYVIILCYVFFSQGVPWIANWMWQRFYDYKTDADAVIHPSVWEIPAACETAVACPGW